jgi:hypothetical protein
MRVKFTNPTNKKFGTIEHIENTTGRTLIALGECEAVPDPRRGTNEYLAWRKEQMAAVTAPSPYDTVPGDPDGISWGVKITGKKVYVLRRTVDQLAFLDGPPAGCPATIAQQFFDALSVADPDAARAAIEAAKRKQQEQDRKDKAAGNIQVMVGQFGTKPL